MRFGSHLLDGEGLVEFQSSLGYAETVIHGPEKSSSSIQHCSSPPEPLTRFQGTMPEDPATASQSLCRSVFSTRHMSAGSPGKMPAVFRISGTAWKRLGQMWEGLLARDVSHNRSDDPFASALAQAAHKARYLLELFPCFPKPCGYQPMCVSRTLPFALDSTLLIDCSSSRGTKFLRPPELLSYG